MSKYLDILTDVKIRNTRSGNSPVRLRDGRGLFLQIMPHGGKWWRFRYLFGGKEKLISLGVYPDVGLKEARSRRDEARQKVATGINPSAQRQAVRKQLRQSHSDSGSTFEAVAREWLNKFSSRWVPTHTSTVIQRLEDNIFPAIGARSIADITPPQLLEVLRRIESRGAVSTAHRTKQICGQVFRYAIATGRASRDPSADLKGALTPERGEHFGAITNPKDVAGLMRAIKDYPGGFIVKYALWFSALTFARPGEIRNSEWSEIHFDEALWRIPAERMKARRDHLVPLSAPALEVLRKLQPHTGKGRYIFPTTRSPARPMSENTVTVALQSMGYSKGQMTAHGFRSLASTLLNEQGWPKDVIEAQLAYSERDEVRSAYNRAQYLAERRRMMDHWGQYLHGLANNGITETRPQQERIREDQPDRVSNRNSASATASKESKPGLIDKTKCVAVHPRGKDVCPNCGYPRQPAPGGTHPILGL